MAGNTKLELSRSVAQIVGPRAAGLLVQWFTAPIAIAADAVSFVASAMSFAFGADTQPTAARRDDRRGIVDEVRTGSQALGSPLLRTLAGAGSAYNLFGNMLFAVFLLYAARDLGLQGVQPRTISAMS